MIMFVLLNNLTTSFTFSIGKGLKIKNSVVSLYFFATHETIAEISRKNCTLYLNYFSRKQSATKNFKVPSRN